ncbi:MAG: hypothetical protein F7C07_07735 [Desulfurococcales archaeon]|nr:hypothetical protein [Desulfurococcales archaeon]
MKYYLPDDLLGAIIIDSVGLEYGVVSEVRFSDQGVELVASVSSSTREVVVDVEKLRERLQSRGAMAGGESDLDYLVALARRMGIDVPYKEAESPITLTKGKVRVEEIAWIDDGVFQDPESLEERRFTVVLLKTPREARYRGLKEGPHKPAHPVNEEIRGKLVLSRAEGIVGIAGSIVLGPGEVGIRAYRRYGGLGFINWIGFLNHLKKRGLEKEYEELAAQWDPFTNPRIPLSELARIKERLSSIGGGLEREIESYIIRGDEKAIYRDIPWRKVVSVRDAIIVE